MKLIYQYVLVATPCKSVPDQSITKSYLIPTIVELPPQVKTPRTSSLIQG